MSNTSNRAVIWDMDGVIADTAELHFRSWQYAFGKRQIQFSQADFQRNFGRRNDAIIRNLLGDTISGEDIEAISEDKEVFFREDAKNKLTPFPGVVNLLKILRDNHFLAAVASSAPLENIMLILSELGIAGFFQTIVYGKEVMVGKPSPLVFLKAASRLGVSPSNCIVIEDAVAGVQAAKAAGMRCIAVTNSHPAVKLTEADMVVNSLVLVGIDDLEKLLNKTN